MGVLVIVLGMSALLIVPVLLLIQSFRNSLLTQKQRISWILGQILLFPLGGYLYGIFHLRNPVLRMLCMALPALLLVAVWPLIRNYRATPEIGERIAKIETLQAQLDAMPASQERDMARRNLETSKSFFRLRRTMGGSSATLPESFKKEAHYYDTIEDAVLKFLADALSDGTLTTEEYRRWEIVWKKTIPAQAESDTGAQ